MDSLNKNKYSAFIPCVSFVIICFLISGVSGWVTSSHIHSWYLYLEKPSFTPPIWLFGPVWTVIYFMIGVSGGLLWARRNKLILAFSFYLIQLGFNFSWSFVFFGMQQIGWAFLNIIFLLFCILATIVFAYPNNKAASWMLVPYLFWVIFASILNFSLWQLN